MNYYYVDTLQKLIHLDSRILIHEVDQQPLPVVIIVSGSVYVEKYLSREICTLLTFFLRRSCFAYGEDEVNLESILCK